MRQLQGMDASFVALETRNSPMHIGSILIYNPATAPGGFGCGKLAALQAPWRFAGSFISAAG